MRKLFAIAVCALLFNGCAPSVGVNTPLGNSAYSNVNVDAYGNVRGGVSGSVGNSRAYTGF